MLWVAGRFASKEPLIKFHFTSSIPSGAKARAHSAAFFGTAEVVHFQNIDLIRGALKKARIGQCFSGDTNLDLELGVFSGVQIHQPLRQRHLHALCLKVDLAQIALRKRNQDLASLSAHH